MRFQKSSYGGLIVNDSFLDIKNITRIVVKRHRLILASLMLSVLLTVAVNNILPEVYEAEITVRIRQPKGLANSLLADQPIEGSNTKQLMQSNTEILKSRTVAQNVSSKLSESKDWGLTPKGVMDRISTLQVNAEILKIIVQGKTPDEAQTIATTLMDSFVQRVTELSRMEQNAARQFIGKRLLDAKGDLEKAEIALENYKRDQKIVAPTDEIKAMVDKIASMKKIDAENDMAVVSDSARLKKSQEKLSQQKQGVLADNQLIQQQKNKLAELEIQKANLLSVYTDDHPKVVSVQASIDNIKENLDLEISRVINGDAPSTNTIHQRLLENEIQAATELVAAGVRKEEMGKIIARDQQEIAEFPAKEHGLAIVERDVIVAREQYAMLAKRHEEARINEVMQPVEVQVIDAPNASPTPVRPKKMLNILLGLVIGLFNGIALAVLLEHLHRKITTDEDVQKYLDLPVFGVVPDFADEPRSTYERYKVRLKILFMDLNVRR